MTDTTLNVKIKYLLAVCLIMGCTNVYCQDKKFEYPPDSILNLSFTSSFTAQPFFNYIYHSPQKKDYNLYNSYRYLVNVLPSEKNHIKYFSLACALWELEKTQDAEKMFLTIINSVDDFYTGTYYHSSDVPGDKAKHIYEYGSYTSNYKNYAAIYLCKIYIERKEFDKALRFLDDAVNKYKVEYTCGTGFYMQQDEYTSLYADCYQGLNRNKDLIDRLLPGCLSRQDDMIVKAIHKMFNKQQIRQNLEDAENSMTCSLDTFPSYSYQTTYGKGKKKRTDTMQYYSGQATMLLFGKQIDLPSPNLENGEHVTKEKFMKLFKQSDFYKSLTENKETADAPATTK